MKTIKQSLVAFSEEFGNNLFQNTSFFEKILKNELKKNKVKIVDNFGDSCDLIYDDHNTIKIKTIGIIRKHILKIKINEDNDIIFSISTYNESKKKWLDSPNTHKKTLGEFVEIFDLLVYAIN